MKLSALACAVWIGITTPTIAFTMLPSSATAALTQPQGLYLDNDWSVELGYKDGTARYYGKNIRTGKKLDLAGATLSSSGNKKIYTWNNAGTRYRVTWQPKDPDFIRLQVIDANGTERLNRLLTVEYGC
jgi:hypothetical protein